MRGKASDVSALMSHRIMHLGEPGRERICGATTGHWCNDLHQTTCYECMARAGWSKERIDTAIANSRSEMNALVGTRWRDRHTQDIFIVTSVRDPALRLVRVERSGWDHIQSDENDFHDVSNLETLRSLYEHVFTGWVGGAAMIEWIRRGSNGVGIEQRDDGKVKLIAYTNSAGIELFLTPVEAVELAVGLEGLIENDSQLRSRGTGS